MTGSNPPPDGNERPAPTSTAGARARCRQAGRSAIAESVASSHAGDADDRRLCSRPTSASATPRAAASQAVPSPSRDAQRRTRRRARDKSAHPRHGRSTCRRSAEAGAGAAGEWVCGDATCTARVRPPCAHCRARPGRARHAGRCNASRRQRRRTGAASRSCTANRTAAARPRSNCAAGCSRRRSRASRSKRRSAPAIRCRRFQIAWRRESARRRSNPTTSTASIRAARAPRSSRIRSTLPARRSAGARHPLVVIGNAVISIFVLLAVVSACSALCRQAAVRTAGPAGAGYRSSISRRAPACATLPTSCSAKA